MSAHQRLAAVEELRKEPHVDWGPAPRSAPPEGEDTRLGARLVQLGRLAPIDVQRIAQAQSKSTMRFGELAVKLGLVSRADVADALALQFNFPSVPDWARRSELLVATTPRSGVAEAVRTLRTQLALHWMNKRQTLCLAIVSADRGEGRSFIAANLALAFAQINERTLLIDMNLRQPRQHEIFRVGNRYGVTSLLNGRDSGREIQRIEGYSSLYLLTSGPAPPSPQELLTARSLTPTLERLRKQFDIVLVDTPAWQCGADAQMIASQTGDALLVSAPQLATRQSTDQLLAALRRVGVSIAGAAVNQR
jgi:protein-tyrosine kinase